MLKRIAHQILRRQGRRPGERPLGLVIPREHGAWAMWIVPGVIGVVLAEGNYHLSALFLVAALLLFWARYPIWMRVRSRSQSFEIRAFSINLLMGLTGMSMSIYLVVAYERWLMVGLGVFASLIMALHLRLAATRHERSLLAEFLGIAGLGLTGPATYYVASGFMDAQALLAWLLPSLFFGSSVFSVKLRVEGFARRRAGGRSWPMVLALVGYQGMALMALALLSLAGFVSTWVMAAYLPLTVHVVWLARNSNTPPRLGRLGMLWLAHSVLFTILVSILT